MNKTVYSIHICRYGIYDIPSLNFKTSFKMFFSRNEYKILRKIDSVSEFAISGIRAIVSDPMCLRNDAIQIMALLVIDRRQSREQRCKVSFSMEAKFQDKMRQFRSHLINKRKT